MTTPRSLPARLARVVEALELDQPQVVTLAEITDIAERTDVAHGEDGARRVAYELQRHGWLGRLRTMNTWEFLPGARAGRYGSGDPLIELRARLAVNPTMQVALAMESAAVKQRLAQHAPEQEVVSLPAGDELPKSLRAFRVVHVEFRHDALDWDDPIHYWSVEALLVGIAARPSGYRDLAGLAQWLPDSGARIHDERLLACMTDVNTSTRQRVIYLLQLAGRDDLAQDLAQRFPPTVPVWFGAARSGGRQNRLSRVLDAELAPLLSGGTGA